MKNILTTLLLTFCLSASVNAQDELPITVYFLPTSQCQECANFHLYVGRFYHETPWDTKANLKAIPIDRRAPQLIPDWYKEAFLDGRTWEPTVFPTFIIWAKTSEHPKGREVARFSGFRDPASWYESLKVLYDAIQPHMKDGVYQEDGLTK